MLKKGLLLFIMVASSLSQSIEAKDSTALLNLSNKNMTYNLFLPKDRLRNKSSKPVEEGKIAFSVNSEYLVIRLEFQDSSIIANGDRNQMHHNELGDVCEIFLKPVNSSYYWELFITPKNKQSSFLWFGQGKPGKNEGKENLIKLISKVNKTSTGWNALVKIPIKELEQRGDKFLLNGSWATLIARQNFTNIVDKKHRELSSFPQINRTNFHATDQYIKIINKKK